MSLIKTLAATTIAATVAGSAIAGGFATEIVEPPVVVVEPAASGSLPGWVIPAVIVAALIGVASSSDDDNDGDANANAGGNS